MYLFSLIQFLLQFDAISCVVHGELCMQSSIITPVFWDTSGREYWPLNPHNYYSNTNLLSDGQLWHHSTAPKQLHHLLSEMGIAKPLSLLLLLGRRCIVWYGRLEPDYRLGSRSLKLKCCILWVVKLSALEVLSFVIDIICSFVEWGVA